MFPIVSPPVVAIVVFAYAFGALVILGCIAGAFDARSDQSSDPRFDLR